METKETMLEDKFIEKKKRMTLPSRDYARHQKHNPIGARERIRELIKEEGKKKRLKNSSPTN